jgi:hypothetical protein
MEKEALLYALNKIIPIEYGQGENYKTFWDLTENLPGPCGQVPLSISKGIVNRSR